MQLATYLKAELTEAGSRRCALRNYHDKYEELLISRGQAGSLRFLALVGRSLCHQLKERSAAVLSLSIFRGNYLEHRPFTLNFIS